MSLNFLGQLIDDRVMRAAKFLIDFFHLPIEVSVAAFLAATFGRIAPRPAQNQARLRKRDGEYPGCVVAVHGLPLIPGYPVTMSRFMSR